MQKRMTIQGSWIDNFGEFQSLLPQDPTALVTKAEEEENGKP